MRHLRTASVAAAMILAAVPTSLFSASALDKVEQTPQYPNFDSEEVNGEVVVEVPKDVSAHIKITFDSPEHTDALYYDKTVSGASLCGFQIEGRDTTDDDFRDYHLNIQVSNAAGFISETYSETFNILDVNDNPNSFKSLQYKLSMDEKDSDKPWEIVSDKDGVKEIVFHLNKVMLGDVDGSGAVNADDASLVLTEYAKISTTNKGTFTAAQIQAADVNGDTAVNADDASSILKYYALTSAGKTADWSEIVGNF